MKAFLAALVFLFALPALAGPQGYGGTSIPATSDKYSVVQITAGSNGACLSATVSTSTAMEQILMRPGGAAIAEINDPGYMGNSTAEPVTTVVTSELMDTTPGGFTTGAPVGSMGALPNALPELCIPAGKTLLFWRTTTNQPLAIGVRVRE